MRDETRSARAPGFTLVELLIVVGIIAALIAILLPALNRARESANRIKCLSNIRQLSTAWIMYANENKGRFCLAVPTADKTGNLNFSWLFTVPYGGDLQKRDPTTGMLWRYIKDKRIYTCPDDPQQAISIGTNAPSGYSYGQNSQLGGGNERLMGSTSDSSGPVYYSIGQVKHSERTALFIETGDASGHYQIQKSLPYYRDHTLVGGFLFAKWHFNGMGKRPGGCTISYVDGHALFWTYSADVLTEDAPSATGPDLLQLCAWSGIGQIPPGVTP